MRELPPATVSTHVNTGLLILLSLFTTVGCSPPVEKVDTIPFELLQDQQDRARSYRDEAMILKEKAAMIAESAVRYERLFGPQSDWVSGAQQLSNYYATAAQDLERRADAHDQAVPTRRSQGR